MFLSLKVKGALGKLGLRKKKGSKKETAEGQEIIMGKVSRLSQQRKSWSGFVQIQQISSTATFKNSVVTVRMEPQKLPEVTAPS